MLILSGMGGVGTWLWTFDSVNWKENDRARKDFTLKNEIAKELALKREKVVYFETAIIRTTKIAGRIVELKIKRTRTIT